MKPTNMMFQDDNGCLTFTVLTAPIEKGQSEVPMQRIILIVEEAGENAPEGKIFSLQVEASDSPLDIHQQKSSESLIVITIVSPTTPDTTPLTTGIYYNNNFLL